MQAFRAVSGQAASIGIAHIDTDQILPARFMMTLSKAGLGRHLFHDWRYTQDGAERPLFVLNRPGGRAARILITHENFGCGSSREHAVWALADFGIRAIIAPSFGSIFATNCVKNGLLPVVLPREACDLLITQAEAGPEAEFCVDLERRCVVPPCGEALTFAVSEDIRAALLAGTDEIARTLAHHDALSEFEAGRWPGRR